MKKNNLLLTVALLLASTFSLHLNAQSVGTKPELIMYRVNSSPTVSPTPINNNDILGTIRWNGLTAIGAIRTGATIHSVTKSTFPGSLAANMIFSTNNGINLVNRMIITENGLVGIGTLDPQYHLDVVGNTHTSGRFFGRIHFDNNPGAPDGPTTYNEEAYFERKSRSGVGVPAAAGVNDNGGVLTLAPFSLADDHQLYFGQDGIWARHQNGTDAAWTAAWNKLLTSADINGTAGRISRFTGVVGTPSTQLGDSQLFDDGTHVGIGTVTPNPAFLLTVAGDAQFNNNLRVNTDLGVGNNLTVGGISNLNGNTNVTGNVAVTGSTATSSLSVTNNATTGSLNVNQDATVSNNCRVNGRLVVGNPASTPGAHELYINGSAIAEEVVVKLQANWPDYVFEKGYELTPLADVEQYIQENKHLPGVATAQEVATDGLELGKTQKAQMEKIEELYLHMIALEKRINSLETENQALKSALEAKK